MKETQAVKVVWWSTLMLRAPARIVDCGASGNTSGPRSTTSSAIHSKPLSDLNKIRFSVRVVHSPAPLLPTYTTGTYFPIGQLLWLKELETYQQFPPMQSPASYNLSQVYKQMKQAKTASHSGE